MTKKIKNNFKNIYSKKNFLNLHKHGSKIYFNINTTSHTKKDYRLNKYLCSYNYNIYFTNFNTLIIRGFIVSNKNKEYVNLIKYLNIFNNNLIFCNDK